MSGSPAAELRQVDIPVIQEQELFGDHYQLDQSQALIGALAEPDDQPVSGPQLSPLPEQPTQLRPQIDEDDLGALYSAQE